MINLYIFNESSRAAVFGIGTYIRELTAVLRDSSIKVNVVHLYSYEQDTLIVEEAGIWHWYIPRSIINQTKDLTEMSERYYRNVVYLLQLHIKDRNNMIFHLNFNRSLKLAERLKEVFDCKIVTTVHYLEWGFSLLGNQLRLNHILTQGQPSDFEKSIIESVRAEKLLYLQVDNVISLTKYMRGILIEHYCIDSEKIEVIPNGLANSIGFNTDSCILRDRWMIDQKTKIIVFAGRMDEIKGLNFLIQSFIHVLEQIPDSRLIIAGNGDYELYLKEAKNICSKIIFTGYLEKQELYELYSMADIGVVPSLYEPFGYVAVEMMMHSLPIVVSRTSGLNEIVDEISGLKVSLIEYPDRIEIDTDLLAEKILFLLQQPEIAKQIGKNGFVRYSGNYTSEIFRWNMIQFYQSLLN